MISQTVLNNAEFQISASSFYSNANQSSRLFPSDAADAEVTSLGKNPNDGTKVTAGGRARSAV